ncbi:MAG: tetratricopeptide repeat protein [Cryobacterium sp.]|nr:tetratricopeptide repeat protein [Cryobacterium sp.]
MIDDAEWDRKVEGFYKDEFDETDPVGSIARMRSLASDRPHGDAAALFELGSVHDALEMKTEAIPLYKAAIAAGIQGERATRVLIQLASTLRNVGESSAAIAMLESGPSAGDDESARQAFLALALFDDGRYGDAPRTALLALIPTLDGYQRALSEYAEELPSTVTAREKGQG